MRLEHAHKKCCALGKQPTCCFSARPIQKNLYFPIVVFDPSVRVRRFSVSPIISLAWSPIYEHYPRPLRPPEVMARSRYLAFCALIEQPCDACLDPPWLLLCIKPASKSAAQNTSTSIPEVPQSPPHEMMPRLQPSSKNTSSLCHDFSDISAPV